MDVATTPFLQELISSHSRKLLLHSPLHNSPPPLAATPPQLPKDGNTFDANVVMVLSVLLCALICSLGLNSIIRCALRCSTLVAGSDSSHDAPSAAAARLANTGVKKKALKKFLTISYATDLMLPCLDTECAICLSDFAPGESVRVLPKCKHGFHVRCIDRWLNSHSSCPTCRHCLVETCNKLDGCSQTSASAPATVVTTTTPLQDQQVVIRIEPLQREGLIHSHTNLA